MSKKSILKFPFPLGGLDRRTSFRGQPPFTTYDLKNVRGEETIEGRERGGTRPGLVRGYGEELGDGEPVRMLAQVTNVGAAGGGYFFYWGDEFARDGSDLGTGWSDASWVPEGQPPTKIIIGGTLVERPTSGAVCQELDYSRAFPYVVEMRIVPYSGKHWGTYRLFARMDDDSPDLAQEGVEVKLILTGSGGNYVCTVSSTMGGVKVTWPSVSGDTGTSTAGWLKLHVDGNDIQVFWKSVLLFTKHIGSHGGRRVGFGMSTTGWYPTGISLVDVFRLQGTPHGGTGSQKRRTYLVASAGSKLYAERTIGELSLVSGDAANFASDHLFLGAEREQLLYIADYGVPRLAGTDGTIDAAGTKLTADWVDDWTIFGINTDTDVVVITNGLGLVTDGTYTIASVAPSGLTVQTSTGGAGTCSYRIERCPKIYDAGPNTVSLWTADSGKGQVPTGCPLICLYRDRMVLAGAEYAPHMWYASRAGDPLDWNYSPEDPNDPARAIAGQDSDAGLIGDVVTAMVPFSDDFLIFGCKGSLWVMRGDPAWGGSIDAISYSVGIIDKKAWAQGPHGELVFLSYDGLYMLEAGANSQPKRLSRDKLPRDLASLNPETHDILLVWDEGQSGVHIYLTPKEGTGWEGSSPSPSPTASASVSASVSASASPTPSASVSASPTPSASASASASVTASPPGQCCNLPDQLTVRLLDLGGDFAAYEGAHVLNRLAHRATECYWRKYWPGAIWPYVLLRWETSNGRWEGELWLTYHCVLYWHGSSDICNPYAAYSLVACSDSGCENHESCELSADATFEVLDL